LKAAGVSAVTLGLAATGCGGNDGTSADGNVTIRYSWWGAEERAKKINQSIALFEKKYPKIKVKTDFQDYPSFWEKFQTQAAGGNPPDVFQNAVGFLRKYDKRGVLLDLKSQIDAGNLSLDHFRAGVTKVGEVDGKQLGIPVGSNTMALVIDKKVYEKAGVDPTAGWTWDEYFNALKTIHDKTKVPGTRATSASCTCTTSTSGRTARRSSPRTGSVSRSRI
jgi:multiple sugar transport system substrate-binding protein